MSRLAFTLLFAIIVAAVHAGYHGAKHHKNGKFQKVLEAWKHAQNKATADVADDVREKSAMENMEICGDMNNPLNQEVRLDSGCVLPFRRLCDGGNDCGLDDESDEDIEKCGRRDCPAGITKRCPANSDNGNRCLPDCWICDGINDCGGRDVWDESQAAGCDLLNENSIECRGKYKCDTTNLCIPRGWLCDCENDCGDNSDEDGRAGCSLTDKNRCNKNNNNGYNKMKSLLDLLLRRQK